MNPLLDAASGEPINTHSMHQQFFAELQQLADVGSFDWNVRTNELRWSKKLYEIYGLDPSSSMTLQRFMDHIHPDDRAAVHRGIAEAMASTGFLQQEERILRADGRERLLASSGAVIRDDQGNPTHFIGVCRDITAQRRMELDLQWQRDGLALLAESSNELLAVHRSPVDFQFHLNKFAKHLGCDAHVVYCWEHCEPQIQSQGGDCLALVQIGNQECSQPIRTSDFGVERNAWCYSEEELRSTPRFSALVESGVTSISQAYFIDAQNAIGLLLFSSKSRKSFTPTELAYVVAVRDLLRSAKIRFAADEERRRSEQRYRLITENSRMIIWESAIDAEEMSYFYGPFESVFGFGREEWYVKGFWERQLHPEDRDRIVSAYKRSVAEEKELRLEYRMIHRNGATVWVDDEITMIRDEQGKTVGLRGSLIDITARKELENRNSQSQKMEAVGNLAGGIAHDFNNLLTAIMGNLEVALLDPPQASSAVLEAKKATESAAGIVRHLLRFSKKSKLELGLVDCNRVVHSAIAFLKHAIDASISLELILQPELPWVDADQSSLEQVLVNLCLNARDAMPEGGKILIRTETQVNSLGLPSILISVKDNGVGMNDEIKKRVFEPFFTTKEMENGTGLGLSTCYAVVKQHGGQIECRSEENQGAEFLVWLPVSRSPVPIYREPKSLIQNSDLPKERAILIVDDEEIVLKATSSLLQCLGFKTLLANSGEDAMNLLVENPNSVQLVLLDLTMPLRSGKEVLQNIKREYPGIPVVICSGYVCGELDFEGLIQPDAVVHKPFSLDEIQTTIARLIVNTSEYVSRNSD